MSEKELDDIYATLCGLYIPEAMVPGVPDLFAEGSCCMAEYIRMRRAYERVCRRLGRDPEDGDADLEIILEAAEHIQERLAKEMFRLGMQYPV